MKPGPAFVIAISKSLILNNCKFLRNKATTDIAGVALIADLHYLQIENSVFEDNFAENSSGALFLTDVNITKMHNNVFYNNKA